MASNLDFGGPTAATPPKASPVNAQKLWSQYCIPPLSPFLKQAGAYTAEQQRHHPRLVRDTVVPRIGPQTSTKSLWTYHGSPFEFSINLTRRFGALCAAKLNAFRTAEHVSTFGGKRRGETTLQGLESLRKIWYLLLNEPQIAEDDDLAAAPADPDSRYKTLPYRWEMRQGQ
ncbi:hypothetical protein DL770_006459 [Monosporascus sp. CRB-9-2]|nr:hypothetical protein DL770_006459 [Monosporascus sp. CRB-9-2]